MLLLGDREREEDWEGEREREANKQQNFLEFTENKKTDAATKKGRNTSRNNGLKNCCVIGAENMVMLTNMTASEIVWLGNPCIAVTFGNLRFPLGQTEPRLDFYFLFCPMETSKIHLLLINFTN